MGQTTISVGPFQRSHSISLSNGRRGCKGPEPGADRDMVVVKNVNTRFGMSRTTGTALIYGSAESKSIEPDT
ncbi:MAG: hypothetical protein Ct9H90mP24_7150 [Methanobacteriota archaeon]|nr:MAG: hypothetical protein Ct9H90mP24_7150 [Euryarchaeota archaeon]